MDCLGLTKRWSLYVASHGNSRVWDRRSGTDAPHRSPDATNAELHPYSPVSVRAVAPGAMLIKIRALEPRLEQPALSLSHLTWS